ncbi:hypothetical protein QVM84_30650, partial [Enterobacter hormaechei]
PGQASSPGSGDQRYFRIQIIWTGQNQAHYADIVVLVPEQEAPESLIELWKKGEGCVCDYPSARTNSTRFLEIRPWPFWQK